jgi:hypothetical protein
MVLLDASLHRWLEDRGPQLTLGFLDDAMRKVLVAEFFPTEDASYLRSKMVVRQHGERGAPLPPFFLFPLEVPC